MKDLIRFPGEPILVSLSLHRAPGIPGRTQSIYRLVHSIVVYRQRCAPKFTNSP